MILGPMTDQASRRKIHIAVDEQTLEIRALEVTSSAIGDTPVLPDLLDQIASQEKIARVAADGAYDTRACHDAIAARGAVAIIPPRKNARLWKPTTEGPSHVTMLFARPRVLGECCGASGAGITVAAGWKRK